jgi:AcrR family transcriptional regulator
VAAADSSESALTESTRRQKPGRPARLSAALIVDTALALVQRSHLSQLTMRALADELGATPMAIYKHVQGRDELELLVVTRSFAGLKSARATARALRLRPRGARAGR